MASNRIPRIDIAPMLAGDPVGKRRIAERVRDALETIGFFTIVGHGVPEAVVRDARDAAYEFFALPLAEKMRIPRPSRVATRGYDPPANQSLAATHGHDTPPDLQELFGMGEFDLPDDPYYTEGYGKDFFAPNRWPERPARMRPAFEAYYRALRGIGDELMRIFAIALRIDEHWFDDKIARSISYIRVNKYMAQPQAPLPGQLRAGAHTDYGTLTILYGEDRPGGLQVFSPEGEWNRCPAAARRVRGQHRRHDGALDERSLGIDAASGGEPAAERGPGRTALDRLLPSARPRCRDPLHRDLSRPRQSDQVPAGDLRRLPLRKGAQQPACRGSGVLSGSRETSAGIGFARVAAVVPPECASLSTVVRGAASPTPPASVTDRESMGCRKFRKAENCAQQVAVSARNIWPKLSPPAAM